MENAIDISKIQGMIVEVDFLDDEDLKEYVDEFGCLFVVEKVDTHNEYFWGVSVGTNFRCPYHIGTQYITKVLGVSTQDLSNCELVEECTWCNNFFVVSDLEQTSMGLMCDSCIRAIRSRGEEPNADEEVEFTPIRNSYTLSVEIYKEEDEETGLESTKVWIGSEDGSGATYSAECIEDLVKVFSEYAYNYIE